MIGRPLPAAKFEVVNKIPNSHLKRLPQTIPVFRYSAKPVNFSIAGLQMLLDESPFVGTNILDLLHGQTNVEQIQEPIRLATARSLDHFFVDPSHAGISIGVHGIGVDIRKETPPYDAIPNFDAIRDRVLRYAELFGVNTNEIERKEDGSLLLHKTDSKTVMRGGAVKFISERSVAISRSIDNHVIHLNNDSVKLTLGVNGCLLDFELNWRPMEAVRTNRVFAVNEILDNIKKGEVLADVTNEYPDDGIVSITLKDIRIDYYTPTSFNSKTVSTNPDIFPIASIYCTFKSKSGKSTDGGLFARIAE